MHTHVHSKLINGTKLSVKLFTLQSPSVAAHFLLNCNVVNYEIHTLMYTHIHTPMYTHTLIYTHIHSCTHTYTHVHTHTLMYTYTHVHIHSCTYTLMYTHIHSCTHTYTHNHHNYPTYFQPKVLTIKCFNKISVLELTRPRGCSRVHFAQCSQAAGRSPDAYALKASR